MIMQGMPFNFPMFAGFIFMLGITMVAAPGVPGGAIMAALGTCLPCWDSEKVNRL